MVPFGARAGKHPARDPGASPSRRRSFAPVGEDEEDGLLGGDDWWLDDGNDDSGTATPDGNAGNLTTATDR